MTDSRRLAAGPRVAVKSGELGTMLISHDDQDVWGIGLRGPAYSAREAWARSIAPAIRRARPLQGSRSPENGTVEAKGLQFSLDSLTFIDGISRSLARVSSQTENFGY